MSVRGAGRGACLFSALLNRYQRMEVRTIKTIDELKEQRGAKVYLRGSGFWRPDLGEFQCPGDWRYFGVEDSDLTCLLRKGRHWIVIGDRKTYDAIVGTAAPLSAAERAWQTLGWYISESEGDD